MKDNWQCIHKTNYEYIAEIIKGVLADNQIQCYSVNKKDSAYLFGEIELYVSYDDVIRAKQILEREKIE